MSSVQFLKALRALSARYVERRAGLAERSALDSAGKRAAFAAYYAPLHFFTVRGIVQELSGRAGSGADPLSIGRLIDFGCGTGAASAAWALKCASPPSILGVDASGWAIGEAAWTWRTLGLDGRARRGDLVEAADRACRATGREPTGWLFAWSLNELATPARDRLLRLIADRRPASARLLVIEPIARGVTPWWDDWARALDATTGEWRLDLALPPELERIREAAGFRRESLTARTLWCPAQPHP
jgi:peptidoglycan/xylan/chitin deacetylase (PgdA/CDA1 family)